MTGCFRRDILPLGTPASLIILFPKAPSAQLGFEGIRKIGFQCVHHGLQHLAQLLLGDILLAHRLADFADQTIGLAQQDFVLVVAGWQRLLSSPHA